MSSCSSAIRRFAAIVLATLLTTCVFAGDPHNLILFVPEALPSASVDNLTAPALSRLRHDGVSFTNAHSGFPILKPPDPGEPSDLNLTSLIAAAASDYNTALIQDRRSSTASADPADQSPNLRKLLTVTLPRFKSAGRPFLLIYRLTEAPYTPPAASEIRPAYTPSPRAADDALESIEATLKTLGLHDTTNIIVAAEHGLARILKVSHTSHARVILDKDDTLGVLPPGFLAVDIMAALHAEDASYSLFDIDRGSSHVYWDAGGHPQLGNAFIGSDAESPHLRIEAHGAHDSIYIAERLTKPVTSGFAQFLADALSAQDYVGGIFVNEKRVGRINGALSMKHVVPSGAAHLPDMVITFTSVSTGCLRPTLCTAVIADTPMEEGEPIRATFSRAGTSTFMAARGPDFHREHIITAPASNADIARTVAELLHLDMELLEGQRPGRLLAESLLGYERRGMPRARKQVVSSAPSMSGLLTEVHLQQAGSRSYFDAADTSDAPANQRVAQDDRFRPRWHWPKFRRFTIQISSDDEL